MYELVEGVQHSKGLYESEFIPRVGEKISSIAEGWSFMVLSVEHIVSPTSGMRVAHQSQIVLMVEAFKGEVYPFLDSED